MVKRATLLCDTEYILPTVLPFEITNYSKLQFEDIPEQVSAQPVLIDIPSNTYSSNIPEPVLNKPLVINEHSLKGASIDAEYEMIVEALRKANYNKSLFKTGSGILEE